jgi:hypothetical protein
MRKRRSFEHERELRAVWSDMANVASAGPAVASGYEYQAAPRETVWKPVDLTALVEKVFISPSAKTWFFDLVKKVPASYQVDIPVHQSDLGAEPLFY